VSSSASQDARFRGRVVAVTGAGQGIGFAIAHRFAREGANVVIGELIPERCERATARLADVGLSGVATRLDVADRQSCDDFVSSTLSRFGRLDILVNNAGVSGIHPSEVMPEAAWRQQIDVNLTGTFLCTQAAVRPMIEQRRGCVVNVGSIGGMGGWPMRAAYNAAKAGVITLTEVLAAEWAHLGIRINCVSPGVTQTDMLQAAIRDGAARMDRYRARTPLGRLATVDEIAATVLFLSSEQAAGITGQNVRVDGGWVPWGNPDGVGFPEPVSR
jgi:NAD(P)-dependent dehydrogenase (short-subunit alcohol dehydrogenase family)